MKVTYHTTADDVRAWMRFAIDRNADVHKSIRASRILMPIIALLLGFLVEGTVGAAIGLAFGIIIGVLLIPLLMQQTLNRRIDTAISQLPDGIIGPNSLEVLDDRIVWTTDAAQCHWKRTAIRQVSKTDDHAFVMFGPENALVVPLHQDRSGDVRTAIDLLAGGPPPILPRS